MNRAPAIALLPVLFLLAGCNLWKQPTHEEWRSATGAEQYDRLMWKAVHDQDWKEVDGHLAPNFVGVVPGGRQFDHAAWVEYWKAAQSRDFSPGEFDVQASGPDMIVTYEMKIAGAGSARVVSVWQATKKGWILTAQTLTPLP